MLKLIWMCSNVGQARSMPGFVAIRILKVKLPQTKISLLIWRSILYGFVAVNPRSQRKDDWRWKMLRDKRNCC
jgi:hypothetical protein